MNSTKFKLCVYELQLRTELFKNELTVVFFCLFVSCFLETQCISRQIL